MFGHKGGGTGGGRATVQPADEINLHFTGDFHAVESAHNLLAAMADNAAHRQAVPKLEAAGITWRRVTDAEDRSLRQIVTGVGGRVNGPMREARFDISAASEIMAILALASGYSDLRHRLGDIVLGWTKDREPVRARDIGGIGSLMALLRDALKPNLVQTAEGQPAIVHMGPFGNIAHGCSSILADRLAVNTADLTVTEAGFGADLGFEKFMDIKIRQGGPPPSAAVVVATVRGLKWHGGVERGDLDRRNVSAVQSGALNLANAIRIVNMYGLPAVVAIKPLPVGQPQRSRSGPPGCRGGGSRGRCRGRRVRRGQRGHDRSGRCLLGRRQQRRCGCQAALFGQRIPAGQGGTPGGRNLPGRYRRMGGRGPGTRRIALRASAGTSRCAWPRPIFRFPRNRNC